MAILDLDTLFVIAEAAPVLDRVEAELRGAGKKDLADKVFKLQQDVGLEIDNEMTGSFSEPPPGPESARLRKEYEPVSLVRMTVLSSAYEQLQAGDVRDSLVGVIDKYAAAAGKMPGMPGAPVNVAIEQDIKVGKPLNVNQKI